jgi:hypothetical protein
MYYVTVITTLDDEPYHIGPIGPFDHEATRSAWAERFWEALDEHNKSIELADWTHLIGAELNFSEHSLGLSTGDRKPSRVFFNNFCG